jgi:hypothetical protein
VRWPFQRDDPKVESVPDRDPEGDAPDTADGGPGDVAETDERAGAAAPEAAQGGGVDTSDPAGPGWAALPPLQRTLDPGAPLTAPSADLIAEVNERLAPAQALAPLARHAGTLAPSGTIAVAGPPIEAAGPSRELIQRRVEGPVGVPARLPPVASIEALPPAMTPRPVPTLDVPTQIVQRSLVSAQSAFSDETAAAPASPADAGPPAQPLHARLVDPSTPTIPGLAHAPGTARVESVPADRQPSPPRVPVQRLGLGAPLGRRLPGPGETIQRSDTRDAASPSRAAAPPEPGAPSAPTGKKARQLSVQRSSLADGLPLARAEEATTSPAPTTPESPRHETRPPENLQPLRSTANERSPSAADAPAIPLSEQGAAPERTVPAVMVGSIVVSRSARNARAPSAIPAPIVRPLVGGARSTVAIQGQAEPSAPVGSLGAGAPSAGLRAAGTPVAGAASPDAPSPAALSEAGEPVESGPDRLPSLVMRSASMDSHRGEDPSARQDTPQDTPQDTDQRRTDALPPRSPRAATVQRRAVEPRAETGPLPAVARLIERPPLAGAVALSGPRNAVQRATSPAMSTDRETMPLVSAPARAAAGGRQPDVQRLSAEPTMAAPFATPSTSSSDEPFFTAVEPAMTQVTRTDEAAASSLQRAPADETGGSTASPAAGPAGGGSEKDVDELARRLYERIRSRLSHELLVDRERAGALTDLR